MEKKSSMHKKITSKKAHYNKKNTFSKLKLQKKKENFAFLLHFIFM